MSLEKLPVPTEAQITLLASDFGSVFQARMNAVTVALRNAIIAFNAQIDAAQTASQQVEPAPLDVALYGLNNSYKVTPLSLHHVMKKFGLGALASRLDVLPDDAVTNGFFSAPAAWPNSPSGDLDARNQGTLFVMKHADPAYGTQFFGGLSDADEFKLRRIKNNIVQPWVTLFHNKNIVGVVSQIGGLPVGAIFQTGANPNGYFALDAAGNLEITMIPTIDASLGPGVTQTFTLPTGLSVGPTSFSLTAGIQLESAAVNEGWARAINSCAVSMQSLNVVAITVTSTFPMTSSACTLIIKGRWY